MMSFAGLGDAPGGGEVAGGDDSPVGDVLGVVLTAGINGLTAGAEGLASGDLAACGWLKDTLHPANTKTSPTANVAGTTPLMPGP